MNEARKMTAEEWRQTQQIESQLAYIEQRHGSMQCEAIYPELDTALGAYMAGLDDPEAKASALKLFDAALVRLREVYRKRDYQWDEYVKDPHLFR
jgi:hypothetical protein